MLLIKVSRVEGSTSLLGRICMRSGCIIRFRGKLKQDGISRTGQRRHFHGIGLELRCGRTGLRTW